MIHETGFVTCSSEMLKLVMGMAGYLYLTSKKAYSMQFRFGHPMQNIGTVLGMCMLIGRRSSRRRSTRRNGGYVPRPQI